jgi:excisionase family DNA binding protein
MADLLAPSRCSRTGACRGLPVGYRRLTLTHATQVNNPGMDDQPPPELLTLIEAAEKLGVSWMTIYRRVHAGELPAVKVDGAWCIPREALRQILDGDGAG